MEHTKAYKLAQRFYPNLWSVEVLKSLVKAGKLRQDEYDELVGEN